MYANIRETSMFNNYQTGNFKNQNEYSLNFPEEQTRPSNESVTEYPNYKSYEELINPNITQNFESYLANVQEELDSLDWKVQSMAIETLRSLNKYNPSGTGFLLEVFYEQIKKLINQKRSFIVKNMMLYMLEIIQLFCPGNISKDQLLWIADIMLNKTSSVSKSVKTVADEGLKQLSIKCVCDEVLNHFALMTISTNKMYFDKCFFYLVQSLDQVRDKIPNLKEDTLKQIFKALDFIMINSAINKNYAKNILKFISNLMGADNFYRYLDMLYNTNFISAHSANILLKATKNRESTRPSIAQDLRNRMSQGQVFPLRNRNSFIEINKKVYESENNRLNCY